MSKLMKTMVTSLAIVVIGGAIALVVILNMDDDNQAEAQSVDEIVKYSYETPEITTDLEDGSFVRIQFQIVTNGKKAREEISKRDFQLKNILIKELATMDEEVFKTGLDELEDSLTDRLNELMTTGNVTEVYTIHKILQ
ncbi:MAG TPA: flagellar basal body-associated protein FliL [Bacillota bacterium]|nr:flagellar basal body-associated protein FliL [Bacillota bacterium]